MCALRKRQGIYVTCLCISQRYIFLSENSMLSLWHCSFSNIALCFKRMRRKLVYVTVYQVEDAVHTGSHPNVACFSLRYTTTHRAHACSGIVSIIQSRNPDFSRGQSLVSYFKKQYFPFTEYRYTTIITFEVTRTQCNLVLSVLLWILKHCQ